MIAEVYSKKMCFTWAAASVKPEMDTAVHEMQYCRDMQLS